MSNPSVKSHRFWIAVLGVFSALAVIQIVFLTKQNRELKRAINPPASAVRLDPLKPGDRLDGFSGPNAADQETKLSYDESDYLIFITSAKCMWCEKTLPSWKKIADGAKGRPVRVVGISVDGGGGIKSYAAEKALNFEVVNFPDANLQSAYKANSTPQTILVRRGGRVEKVWMGMLSDENVGEIMGLL